MNIFRPARWAFAGLFHFCLVASGQNAISIVSSVARTGSPVPRTCQEQAAVLAGLLGRFPCPGAWSWVIACDDGRWQQFLRSLHLAGDASLHGSSDDGEVDPDAAEDVYAATDLDARLTWVRGTTLLNPDSSRALPEHVVAHELAHIALHTHDERLAERLALRWLKETGGSRLVVDPRTSQGSNAGERTAGLPISNRGKKSKEMY